MLSRPLLIARLLLIVCVMTASAPAPARDLVVLTRGTTGLAVPFAQATGIPAREDSWDGTLDTLRARNAPGGAGADLALIRADILAAGCEAGLFAKPDFAAFGGADAFAATAGACGVPARLLTTGLVWDRAKFSGTPGWADFFDVAKHPGQRGLRRGARGNLEIALLADGIAPADVYRTLRTQEGLDRAFRKLDQLRPYVTWYDTGEQAARLILAGDVLMTSGPAGHFADGAAAAHGRTLGWQDTSAVGEVLAWAVPAASDMRPQAFQAAALASLPAVAAHLAAAVPDRPLVRAAAAFMDEKAPALIVDDAFWQAGGEAIATRFAAWLIH